MELREFKTKKLNTLLFKDLKIGQMRTLPYKFYKSIIYRENADIIKVEIQSLDSNKTILIYQKNLPKENFKIVEIKNNDLVIFLDEKNVDTIENNIFSEISVNLPSSESIAILKLKT